MAYRLILGREPENADAVATWAACAPDLMSLREQFLTSEEFLSSRVVRLPVSLDWGAESRIDVNVDARLLARMLDRVARTWQALGYTQPFWSVLSADEYKMDRFGENADTYWKSGKGDVDRLNAWLKRNGIPAVSGNHSCCEYGCGTGRVTRWLADQFSRVIAFDISQPHIELAQSHMKRAGKSNVSFRHVDSLVSLNQKMEAVDVFFSFLVLQHNPPPIIALILNTVLQCLKPGGGLLFFRSLRTRRSTPSSQRIIFNGHLRPQLRCIFCRKDMFRRSPAGKIAKRSKFNRSPTLGFPIGSRTLFSYARNDGRRCSAFVVLCGA